MYKVQKDKYQKSRGSSSKILDICCTNCGNHVSYYQKDGPGTLKRMYIDRFIDTKPKESVLKCTDCRAIIGTKFIYQKEKRLAYRLFVGGISKKIVKKDQI